MHELDIDENERLIALTRDALMKASSQVAAAREVMRRVRNNQVAIGAPAVLQRRLDGFIPDLSDRDQDDDLLKVEHFSDRRLK